MTLSGLSLQRKKILIVPVHIALTDKVTHQDFVFQIIFRGLKSFQVVSFTTYGTFADTHDDRFDVRVLVHEENSSKGGEVLRP